MNQVNHEESSGAPSVLLAKRRRGRPRKDSNLKHAGATHDFGRMKESPHQRADRTNGIDIMVGQPVTGVIEASFDAGYLLSVRIGNSDTNLRGIVFKPGHYVPVTAANDVAPHVEMIRRNDVHLPAENQVWSHGQKLAIQPGAIVPSKRKYSSPIISPNSPPVGLKGTVVPATLQPVTFSNGSPASHQTPSNAPQAAHVMEFRDMDVHMVEPLAMLPPDHSMPVSQIFAPTQPGSSRQISVGSEQNNTSSVNEGAPDGVLEEKGRTMTSTDTDASGSSQPSDIQIEYGKETVKFFAEDSGFASIQGPENAAEPLSVESLQQVCVTKPLFNSGPGMMTELLKAVQENMKENDVPEIKAGETDSKNEATFP